ncbi:MAG: endonuclease/exonuclease/phosphatase family protein [Actinomycetota bacterium]
MRVLAYNVQSCRVGVETVADVIQRAAPDVAALNEVQRFQAREIGRIAQMNVTFGATLRWRRFGNALLTKGRPTEVRSALFSVSSREPRGMVRVTLPGGLVVAAVHLGLEADERVAQAGELVAALASAQRAVVAGDMNERPGGLALTVITSRFRDAFAEAGAGDGLTFTAQEPKARIDYVFVSDGIRVERATVLPDVASDHLAVVADLAID